MAVIPEITLGSSGEKMPVIGMGTGCYPPVGPEATTSAILEAIRVGYRHFDTAFIYGSEQPLGEAVAEALRLGLVKSRDELHITTKLWCSFAHRDKVVSGIKTSLKFVCSVCWSRSDQFCRAWYTVMACSVCFLVFFLVVWSACFVGLFLSGLSCGWLVWLICYLSGCCSVWYLESPGLYEVYDGPDQIRSAVSLFCRLAANQDWSSSSPVDRSLRSRWLPLWMQLIDRHTNGWLLLGVFGPHLWN